MKTDTKKKKINQPSDFMDVKITRYTNSFYRVCTFGYDKLMEEFHFVTVKIVLRFRDRLSLNLRIGVRYMFNNHEYNVEDGWIDERTT